MKFLHAGNFPLVLGYDFSGVVEALGPGVAGFAIGTAVYGFLPYGPFNRRGTFAQSVVARCDQIAIKPDTVSHAQAAAAATPGLTALQSLRDLASVRPGTHVLVTGVSGGVGALAVAIAHRLGATVTAYGSEDGLQRAAAAGAKRRIDRSCEDVFSAVSRPLDVVFDAAGAFRPREWRHVLGRGSVFVTTMPSLNFAADKIASLAGGARCEIVMVKSRPADLRLLGDWLAGGLAVEIDRRLALDEVSAGLARLERNEAHGRLVVEL
jgi:NADPH:quinone reductase